jgi:AcrR family transcriptional regulator
MAQRKQQRRSNTRRELVSGEILEKAAALFAERGFSSTSLQDVAEALEISRTALYHYVGGKNELLATLVRGLTQETADSLAAISADRSLDPVEQLAAAIRSMATRIANSPGRFRLLLVSEGSLPEPLASEHKQARRRALRELTAIVRGGIDAGLLRSMDDRVAAFAVLGMCNWVAWWYDPARAANGGAEQLAEELVRLGVAALQAPAERAPSGRAGVEHALDLLRRDLDYLQRTLDRPGAT